MMRLIIARIGRQQRSQHQVPKFLETVLEASPVCNSQGPGLWHLVQGLAFFVFVFGWHPGHECRGHCHHKSVDQEGTDRSGAASTKTLH